MKQQQGFTLIESILYMAILALFLVSVVQLSIAGLQAGQKASIMTEVQQNARFAMERVRRELRSAEGVNTGSSTFDTHPGVLSVVDEVAGENPTVFDVSSGRLRMTEGVAASQFLTTDEVTVDSFIINDRSVTDRTSNYQISLTLSWAASTEAPFNTTYTLQSTVVIREDTD